MEKTKTGTTTVGLKYKDGVVLASDAQASMGHLVASKKAKKVHKLDNKIGVTIAGGVGDAQQLIRVLRAEINLYKIGRNTDMTVNAVSTLLSNVLQSSRMFPKMAMMILGGVDKKGKQLMSIDPLGGEGEEDDFVSTGSGSPMAYGLLEDKYSPEFSEEEAVKLAVDAIMSARQRDIYTGGKKIQVAVISDSGFKKVDQEVLEQLAK